MKKHTKEEKEIPDKWAMSDDDEVLNRESAADHGKSKNTKKWSQTRPENKKQETTGRQPGKSTSPTEVQAKAENTAETNENKDPDIFESSKQGQWPDYLTFFGYPVLICFVIVMFYHLVNVGQLSTISNEKLKSIITSILEEHYRPIFNQIMEEETSKFKSSYLKPLENKITTINEKVKHLDTDTQNVEVNLKNLLSQQKDIPIRIDDIKTELEGAENNIKQVQATIDAQVTQVKSSFEKLNNSLKQLDEKTSAIEAQLIAINNTLQQLTQDQQNISSEHDLQKQEFNVLREYIENKTRHLNKHLETLETNVTSLTSSVSAVDSRFNQTRNLTDAVDSLQSKYEEKIEPNLFNKGQFVIAFMILFVLVLILMVSHYRLYQRIENAEQGNWFQNKPKRFQSSTDILRQVPSKPQLQAAVCIISFDEGRQAAHQQLLDSANLPNCRVVTFVVGRHANIPDLPRCKVYLMCTEFSERHVIIEEQGLGLGDLHRTTYDAVLKLGGQLIILYTRDPGSRRLKDDEVFNKNIYCVTHQEELVELNNLGRFFSVYDTLTAQQKTKLKKTIMDCLQ